MNLLRRWAPTSFRGRIVASNVLLMGAVMVGGVVGIQLLLGYTTQRDIDGVLAERVDAVVAVADAHAPSGVTGLTIPDQALEPGVRVYDDHGRLVAGTLEQEARQAADKLARVASPKTVTVHDELRLLAEPFKTSNGHAGVVVVSQSLAPYERAERDVLVATIGIGLLVIALAAYIARRATTKALEPVTQMAERAADWGEHDLAHRFDLAPADDELAQLGTTLDRLLDRVAMAIRSEQRLTSELAHELRTPLTAIQGSADLALLRGVDDMETRADLMEISQAARAMADVITTLVDMARDPGSSTVAATCHVRDLVDTLRQSVPVHVTLVDDTAASIARIAGPPNIVIRAVAPVLDNAVAHARSCVTLAAVDLPHLVAITVSDDGPGVDSSVRDRIFEVGASGSGGTGLGLAIAQRVARSLGGEIRVGSPDRGASFLVRLPRA